MSFRLVCSKNNLFFVFLVFGYLFGVILYDFLEFKFTDELMALFLLSFSVSLAVEHRSVKELRQLFILFAVFAFYLLYSLLIHSNTPKAIIVDLVTQIKPFLGFYCTYQIAPRFTPGQKRFLAVLSLLVAGVLLIIGVVDTHMNFFGHESRFATAVIVTFFLLYYCSERFWDDLLLLALVLSVGLLSTRSKFYGFWGIALLMLSYRKLGGRVQMNLTSVVLIACLLLIGVGLAREKIILYYVDGMINSREMWSRPAMMLTSGMILWDYFPFGSGLGSFGTNASAIYYSSTYEEYGISNLWGLSREMPDFICDAFYPSLAQFGVVGVVLYILFWYFILRESAKRLNIERQVYVWLITIFFLIEGTADTTFTHNRGLFILILLGMTLAHGNQTRQQSI